MKAIEYAEVMAWLEAQKSGADVNDLQAVATEVFGEIKWDHSMGWGEGSISCTFVKMQVSGHSCGDCTAQEALIEAVHACLKKIE